MRDSIKIALGIIMGVIGLGLCALCIIVTLSGAGVALISSFSNETGPPLSPPFTQIPSPLLPGEALQVDNLYVAVLGYDTTECVNLTSGDESCPREGAIYIWIHLIARHLGDDSDLPVDASFSTELIYREERQPDAYFFSGTLDKPYWPGYTDGSGNTQLYGGNTLEGWLAFSVPSGFDISDVVVHLDNWRGSPDFTQDWALAP